MVTSDRCWMLGAGRLNKDEGPLVWLLGVRQIEAIHNQ
jgi:hypothetical protein